MGSNSLEVVMMPICKKLTRSLLETKELLKELIEANSFTLVIRRLSLSQKARAAFLSVKSSQDNLKHLLKEVRVISPSNLKLKGRTSFIFQMNQCQHKYFLLSSNTELKLWKFQMAESNALLSLMTSLVRPTVF